MDLGVFSSWWLDFIGLQTGWIWMLEIPMDGDLDLVFVGELIDPYEAW